MSLPKCYNAFAALRSGRRARISDLCDDKTQIDRRFRAPQQQTSTELFAQRSRDTDLDVVIQSTVLSCCGAYFSGDDTGLLR